MDICVLQGNLTPLNYLLLILCSLTCLLFSKNSRRVATSLTRCFLLSVNISVLPPWNSDLVRFLVYILNIIVQPWGVPTVLSLDQVPAPKGSRFETHD
ncbi:hypothetical protein FGO68_gene7518 [Halteria grandinella]|uniref:Uncharacterized protein n=1 Tax=Halteria grandinella TaxID=5974 RepID=A0A8J8NG43_HALGN|nr:hypothetical protein FGO68_gene7518 [Halteria grandinella]